MLNQSNIEQSNDNHGYDDDIQEKQFVEKLDTTNKIQQIQIVETVTAGVSNLTSSTSTDKKRFTSLRKLPFPRQSEKPKPSEIRRLKMFEIYRFADKFDVFLMIIGTIAAIITGAIFPLLIFLYGKVTNNLVNMGQLQTSTNTHNVTINNFSECLIIPVNSTSSESPYDVIVGVIKYYAILGSISILFYWIAWTCWIMAAERQVRRMRYALFRNILRQDIGWFDIHNSSELINHLLIDLDTIKDGINDKVPDFISLLGRVLGSLIYSLVVGWKLTLIFLSLLPLMIFASNRIVKITIKYTNKEMKAFALASSIAQEVLQNIRTVTAFHGQEKEEQRFAQNLIEVKNIAVRKNLYLGICQGFIYIVLYSSYTMTFWYGPHLVRTDCTNYSPGSVMIIFMSCMIATVSAAYLSPNIQNFAEALTSGYRVFDIIDRQTKIDASSDEGIQLENLIGDIQFDNVTFTYPARQESSILNKISLKIPAGKTVALVGESGCGKSTIIQLIQRFYDPDSGQILLDGNDLKTLNVAWLRSHIGIVSQEPVLLAESIEDNIRFGKPNATDEEIQIAAKMANAHDFIMEFPENYKTTLGNKLSGGQKQRVAIARALISNPKILLLDEATSALDNTSERIVRDALDRAKEGRTTIMIAHRLSTIQNVDLIIGLEHGQIIEYGTHDDLMKEKGLYYRLVTTQNEKEKLKKTDLDSDEEYDQINEEFIRQRSNENRQISKQISILTDRWEKNNENDQRISIDDSSKKNEKYSKSSSSLSWTILKLNSPEWFWIVLGGISSIIFSATPPIFSLFLSEIIGLFAQSNVQEQKRLTNIYALAIFFIGILGGITQFFILFGFAKSGEALTMRMRKLTFSAILRQEISYFDLKTNSIGILLTRLSTDTSALKGMTGVRLGIILQSLSATITALVVAFTVGWKLTFVVLCFVPLMLFSGILQGKKQSDMGQSKDKGTSAERSGQYATDAIEHIRTVAALHQEKYFIDHYEENFNEEFKKQMCYLHLRGIGAGIANSAVYFLHMTTFGYGNKLVKNGEMEFHHVIRILAAITFATVAVGRSIGVLFEYSKARQAALRIIELDQRKSQINPHDSSGIILDDVRGNIQFDDVHFHYPNRSNFRVLKNFSLKCSSKCTTALVGSSGSGKSTTIALLQRFYDPSKGKILLDGYDIKILNLRWLRSLMGFVQQEPILFNLSIRDNIAYGDHTRQVAQDQIEAAARMANIHQFIISLPKGYETLCGAKGSQLSGGQKQRIAIARALIRSPKILLFDEATSALDSQSEKIVQEAVLNATVDRTCLTIAHRLSTIQNSAKIAVVDRGKIKEEGTHDQLLKLNGIYTKLASMQKKST